MENLSFFYLKSNFTVDIQFVKSVLLVDYKSEKKRHYIVDLNIHLYLYVGNVRSLTCDRREIGNREGPDCKTTD